MNKKLNIYSCQVLWVQNNVNLVKNHKRKVSKKINTLGNLHCESEPVST